MDKYRPCNIHKQTISCARAALSHVTLRLLAEGTASAAFRVAAVTWMKLRRFTSLAAPALPSIGISERCACLAQATAAGAAPRTAAAPLGKQPLRSLQLARAQAGEQRRGPAAAWALSRAMQQCLLRLKPFVSDFDLRYTGLRPPLQLIATTRACSMS
jgi:hypothetical protein